MSPVVLMILLSPLELVVVVGGVVAVVALLVADSKDVPEVARVWCSLFRKLAGRTPMVSARVEDQADERDEEAA